VKPTVSFTSIRTNAKQRSSLYIFTQAHALRITPDRHRASINNNRVAGQCADGIGKKDARAGNFLGSNHALRRDGAGAFLRITAGGAKPSGADAHRYQEKDLQRAIFATKEPKL
jgi:hypothetical protein